jgi:hypothetical protein
MVFIRGSGNNPTFLIDMHILYPDLVLPERIRSPRPLHQNWYSLRLFRPFSRLLQRIMSFSHIPGSIPYLFVVTPDVIMEAIRAHIHFNLIICRELHLIPCLFSIFHSNMGNFPITRASFLHESPEYPTPARNSFTSLRIVVPTSGFHNKSPGFSSYSTR